MKTLTLYPRLVPAVLRDFLEEGDLLLLAELSASENGSRDGTLRDITRPRAERVGRDDFMISETGCDYNKRTRKLMLVGWRQAGASALLLEVLAAAQRQKCPKLIVSSEGMVPERRKMAKIGRIGKGKLSNKSCRDLLLSVKAIYEDLWPVETLANAVKPHAKKTRKAGGRT